MTASLEAVLRVRRGAFDLAVELTMDAGPLVVIGPNGAGKTTLLLSILGIVRPDEGRVRLAGAALFDSAAGIDEPTEARRIAYVPQDYALFPHLTAAGNVAFALDCLWPPPRGEERHARVLALLDSVGALPLAARRPTALSGGERQRVALARALATAPHAFLLDEPLAALDAEARGEIRGFLRQHLAALGLPSIVVTHDVADAAAFDARIVVVEGGRVVQEGSLAALAAAPATPYVARFCAARA